MKKVVIIGAGPAGLTAAYELLSKHQDYDVTVLEQGVDFGGISKTININGNFLDLGGHRYHTKNQRLTDWWLHLLNPQGKPTKEDLLLSYNREYVLNGLDPEKCDNVMLIRERFSRIYYKNTFFDYPLTLSIKVLHDMGFLTSVIAVLSYLCAKMRQLPEDNLAAFLINRFGKKIFHMFFEGYTEKLWGRKPCEISPEWGAERIRGLSLMSVFRHMVCKLINGKNDKKETSLVDRFYFPKYGSGQLWSLAANEIVKMGGLILTDKRVCRAEQDLTGQVRNVICSDGTEYPCDYLISSAPIKDLSEILENIPADLKNICTGLPYRAFQIIGVLVKTDDFLLRSYSDIQTVNDITQDCWIYIQDTSVNAGRVQIVNNWSPYMVNDFNNTVWIGLEYFCDEGDDLWNMPENEFINLAAEELVKVGVIKSAESILIAHRERLPMAYPAYFDTYSQFRLVRIFLDTIQNLYCIGRNGQHRYSNIDYAMITAFAAVDAIVSEVVTKENIWNPTI